MSEHASEYYQAISDFQEARRAADLQRILAKLRGESADLIPYEEVRRLLHARNLAERGVQDVPLDAIIGSVGRYTDFTRTFLPRRDSDRDRWARVHWASQTTAGLPPVELYKVGEAYFVKDGHHRISVARQMGAKHIEAYVTEVQTDVPLTPETTIEELVLKGEYADFLAKTQLKRLRPEADLTLTVAGGYDKLLEHIDVHRYFMGLEQQREIPYEEAVAHWYDTVYLPVVQAIRERGLLHYFPGRTEADLYLWLMEHRAELSERLGWEVGLDEAVEHLAKHEGAQGLGRRVARVGEKLLERVLPDALESGPPPGQWRRNWIEAHGYPVLFYEILVPVSGEARDWPVLDEAIAIARLEKGTLRGLYVHSAAETVDEAKVASVRESFLRRCEEAGVRGELAVAVGDPPHQIIYERSRWCDLVALRLNHPPGEGPLQRLASPFRTLLRRVPRPVVVVPDEAREPRRLLLAYDGSPKAREALYVAAYAAGQWSVRLFVLTVAEAGVDVERVQEEARRYLHKRGVAAEFLAAAGEAAALILQTAHRHDCDLIAMGGYGAPALVEVVVGSTVDALLRRSRLPLLICR